MKQKKIKEKVDYISFLHKQNLSGRETEDELFESGILAGIEETTEEIYNQIKELYDNENITGFSKLAFAKCLDIIEGFKNN